MNIPGFTAEASLYQASRCYQMTGDPGRHGSGEGIIPQAPIILDCFCTPNFGFCCCRDAAGKLVCAASGRALQRQARFLI